MQKLSRLTNSFIPLEKKEKKFYFSDDGEHSQNTRKNAITVEVLLDVLCVLAALVESHPWPVLFLKEESVVNPESLAGHGSH